MPIPESQLDTWSHQGAIAGSRDTYATLKRCLEASSTAFAPKDFRVFLQGSYANDTNIYAESDVDVVICLDSTYYYDIDALTEEAQAAFHRHTGGSASYGYFDFKRDVVAALQGTFGSDVAENNKAVSIEASGSRRKADVIVAAQHRKYSSFSTYRTDDYVQGICFFTTGIERIVNYPKQHSTNMTARHQATNAWLKPAVRIMKNIRRRMEADGLIPPGIAPSYFLEGLMYNVPARCFGTSYESTLVESLNWVLGADPDELVCANEQYYLVRDVRHSCWLPAACDTFLTAIRDYWNDW